MRGLILISIFCLFISTGYAQGIQSGKVMEYQLNIALTGIKVENLNSHAISHSDNKGKFAITAKNGDLICFSGLGYRPDTVYLVDLKYKEIYLTLQQNQLSEVKVKSSEINKNAFAIAAPVTPFGGGTVRYQADAAGNPVGGVGFSLFDSHKDARKREQSRQLESDGQKQAEIDKVFDSKNLQAYLPIKGQELDNFIILYRPDIKTYYSGQFNLTMYLNTCYKSFLEIPEEKRRAKTFLQLNK